MKENDNNKSNTDQKKKKKDKTADNDVNFDIHTILICDSSFFNIPIEAFLYYMIDLKVINREFSVNLLLHKFVSQSYQNNIMNELENEETNKNDSKNKKDKNKKNKKFNIENGISQLTSFNCN